MPGLPEPIANLPGVRWRPLTLDDGPAFVRLMEDARIADGGEEVTTAEIARRELTDPLCPPATNTLAAALPDGALVASIMLHERLQGLASRRVFLWGVTHPDHRGSGIGRAILDWGVRRADEILATQPEHLERLVEAFKEERLVADVALHEAVGFRPARWYFDMRRDLRAPIPPMPDLGDLVIRPYDPSLGELVRLAHNEAFADHWGSEPLTRQIWERDFVGDPFFRDDLSFIIQDGDEVAGYSVNYVIESDWEATGVREGWVGQLGVRRPWRKRGLATALLVRSMEAFVTVGLDAATLGVDAANPTGALGIYERVGFRPIRRSVRLQRPFRGSATAA